METKIVRFGPGVSGEKILEKLDQFYGDQGAAVGDVRTYKFYQQESKEVSNPSSKKP